MSQYFPHQSDDFRPRRYVSHGCGSVFGRGRSILFLVSVFLGLLGLVAPSNSVTLPSGSLDSQVASVTQHQVATDESPVRLLPVDAVATTSFVAQPTELHRLVAMHGGALRDSRATLVRSVGQRLIDASGLQGQQVRFDVLADSKRAVAYTLSSGNVLVTAGVVDRLPAQHKIAGVLARQIERLLVSRGTVPANSVAARLLSNAGFDASSLSATDQQLAKWRSEAGQQTVFASHEAPL